MNFNTQCNLIIEGVRDKFYPITPEELKILSDEFQVKGEMINRYTAKFKQMTDPYSHDPMSAHYGYYNTMRDNEEPELVIGTITYVNHLRENGLWRFINKSKYGGYGEPSDHITFHNKIGYSGDPDISYLHRLDGPAIISDGKSHYFINGVEFDEEKYWNDPRVQAYKTGGHADVKKVEDMLKI